MNGRVVTAFIGVITLALGAYGISYPDRVLGWVGLDLISTNRAAGLVEARAIYGGLFLVLGAFTLWGSLSPRAHRPQLLLIACIWLGIFGARMVGVSIDGNPGVLNTVGAVFEAVVGVLLLAAPYLVPGEGAGDEAPVAPPAP
jgi:hypothetical protein